MHRLFGIAIERRRAALDGLSWCCPKLQIITSWDYLNCPAVVAQAMRYMLRNLQNGPPLQGLILRKNRVLPNVLKNFWPVIVWEVNYTFSQERIDLFGFLRFGQVRVIVIDHIPIAL